MRTFIIGGVILTPTIRLDDHTLVIEGHRITHLIAGNIQPAPGDQIIDAAGGWVVPGFIDIHVHGAAGHDTMDATPAALHGMARFFAQHGVTSYLPTTMTTAAEDISAAIEAVKTYTRASDDAQSLGLHLEGPYLNLDYRGAQNPTHFRSPDHAEYASWFASDHIRLVTVAPELEGMADFIATGRQHGVEFAIGHSGANHTQVTEAANRGVRQATHTFNGMLGLHHRRPGTLGSVLTDERIYCQIIADGIHVHPAMIKLLVRAKGVERTILITDAICATGLPDGAYELGGLPVTVLEGIARIDSGSLAGSTLAMDAALRNIMRFTGLSLQAALPMATSVPAVALNLHGIKGVLAPDADADVLVLDADLQVVTTLVQGQLAYARSAQETV